MQSQTHNPLPFPCAAGPEWLAVAVCSEQAPDVTVAMMRRGYDPAGHMVLRETRTKRPAAMPRWMSKLPLWLAVVLVWLLPGQRMEVEREILTLWKKPQAVISGSMLA